MIRSLPASNPFATRYVRPGALTYRFADERAGDLGVAPERVASERVERVASERVASERRRQILTSLDRHRVGLLLGPHGSGKSTLVQSMLPEFRSHFRSVMPFQLCRHEGSFLKRRSDRRHIVTELRESMRQCEPGSLLIIDGAEQLGSRWLGRLGRESRLRDLALLATCHRPISRFPVLYRTVVTPSLIHQLVGELTSHYPDSVQQWVALDLSRRSLTTQSDVRELFFELFDVVHARMLDANGQPETVATPSNQSQSH